MIKAFPALTIFLLTPLISLSQPRENFASFMKEAGMNSVLFRGSAPMAYEFRYTGTYFAYSPEFLPGELTYNNKKYYNVVINLNSHTDDLLLKYHGSVIMVAVNREFVDDFVIGKRRYVNFREDSRPGAPAPGYYEVVHSSTDTLLKKIRKQYKEEIPQTLSGNERTMNRYFKQVEEYFLLKDGRWIQVKNRKSLLNAYAEFKRDISHFTREAGLNFYENRDESFAAVMKYVETLKTGKR